MCYYSDKTSPISSQASLAEQLTQKQSDRFENVTLDNHTSHLRGGSLATDVGAAPVGDVEHYQNFITKPGRASHQELFRLL